MTSELQAKIRECNQVISLLELLLQFCREESRSYAEWMSSAAHRASGSLASCNTEACRIVKNLSGESWLTPEDLIQIQTFLTNDEQSGHCPCVIQAYLLAQAIEEQFADQLIPNIQNQFAPVQTVKANQLFPVLRPKDLVEWVDAKETPEAMAPKPESSCPNIDELPHFSLGPATLVFHLEVDVRLRAVEASFMNKQGLKLAVGIINADHKDLPLTQNVPNPSQFILHGPVDHDKQRQAIEQVMMLAKKHHADILVFPELCVSHQLMQELLDQCKNRPDIPTICIMGSCHAIDDAKYKNIAMGIVANTSTILAHEKMEFFELAAKYSPTTTQLNEGIHTGTTIRIYHTKTFSLAINICLDFMSKKVIPLVQACRPTFVLVPAYTMKTTKMVTTAASLAGEIQAISLVANGPIPTKSRVVSVVGVPRTYMDPETQSFTVGPTFQGVFPRNDIALPAIGIFHVSTARFEWFSAQTN